jgi:hypothetical protein
MNKNNVLIAFHNEPSLDAWKVTNDGVMGGLSAGKMQFDNNAFVFYGVISIENYGGFTSVFREVPKLSEDIDAISINILGDGNAYQLRVRSQVSGYELGYMIDFQTIKGEQEQLTFYLDDFKASFRGRIIDNAPSLDATSISQVGFLIKAKQVKRFSLSVQSIKFMG